MAEEQKRQAALALKQDGTHSVKVICQLVGISRNTYYNYTRSAPSASAADPSPALPTRQPDGRTERPPNLQARVMKVQLWLQVETTNKCLGWRKKAWAGIELWVPSRDGMEPAAEGGPEHVLTVPYTTDDELDHIIYDEIWREAENIADLRHSFDEGDMTSLEEPDRSW